LQAHDLASRIIAPAHRLAAKASGHPRPIVILIATKQARDEDIAEAAGDFHIEGDRAVTVICDDQPVAPTVPDIRLIHVWASSRKIPISEP
jgi:hypothetical protein